VQQAWPTRTRTARAPRRDLEQSCWKERARAGHARWPWLGRRVPARRVAGRRDSCHADGIVACSLAWKAMQPIQPMQPVQALDTWPRLHRRGSPPPTMGILRDVVSHGPTHANTQTETWATHPPLSRHLRRALANPASCNGAVPLRTRRRRRVRRGLVADGPPDRSLCALPIVAHTLTTAIALIGAAPASDAGAPSASASAPTHDAHGSHSCAMPPLADTPPRRASRALHMHMRPPRRRRAWAACRRALPLDHQKSNVPKGETHDHGSHIRQ